MCFMVLMPIVIFVVSVMGLPAVVLVVVVALMSMSALVYAVMC